MAIILPFAGVLAYHSISIIYENYDHQLTQPLVPVNLKLEDAFHITIEEYLQSLITLIEELARLATNSVTLGDFARPLEISKFVKDLFAGFQILNLKNDSLRRRSDGIKYQVKKIEDVVYDLSLRGLVPKAGSS